MVFERQRTETFSRRRDRDYAPFFAGREAEIARFREALDECTDPDYEAASFRVYQGAPGAGKTSLLNRLRTSFAHEALFVPIRTKDLTSFDALGAAVRNGLIDGANAGFRFGTKAATEILRRFKLTGFADAGEKVVAEQTGVRNRLVLYMDEAQSVTPDCAPGLLELHTHGAGPSAVVLLVGLAHTEERLASAGLSRLAENVVTDMGAMTESECVESTMNMLDAIGTRGDREAAAALVAELSFGWPQHLCGAQRTLCAALLECDGDLRRVDRNAVRTGSDRVRCRYYEGRLTDSVLQADVPMIARIMVAVRSGEVRRSSELYRLCAAEVRRTGLADHPDFAGGGAVLQRALIEKGLVAVRGDGVCEPTIPSMVDWLETVREEQERPRERRGRTDPKIGR